MDKKPRPTPRTSRSTVRPDNSNVDYELLSAVGVEASEYISYDSDSDDPDSCTRCGCFHYGKCNTNPEAGAVYLRPANKSCAECGRDDCTDIGHFIKVGYIEGGTMRTTYIV